MSCEYCHDHFYKSHTWSFEVEPLQDTSYHVLIINLNVPTFHVLSGRHPMSFFLYTSLMPPQRCNRVGHRVHVYCRTAPRNLTGLQAMQLTTNTRTVSRFDLHIFERVHKGRGSSSEGLQCSLTLLRPSFAIPPKVIMKNRSRDKKIEPAPCSEFAWLAGSARSTMP